MIVPHPLCHLQGNQFIIKNQPISKDSCLASPYSYSCGGVDRCSGVNYSKTLINTWNYYFSPNSSNSFPFCFQRKMLGWPQIVLQPVAALVIFLTDEPVMTLRHLMTTPRQVKTNPGSKLTSAVRPQSEVWTFMYVPVLRTKSAMCKSAWATNQPTPCLKGHCLLEMLFVAPLMQTPSMVTNKWLVHRFVTDDSSLSNELCKGCCPSLKSPLTWMTLLEFLKSENSSKWAIFDRPSLWHTFLFFSNRCFTDNCDIWDHSRFQIFPMNWNSGPDDNLSF